MKGGGLVVERLDPGRFLIREKSINILFYGKRDRIGFRGPRISTAKTKQLFHGQGVIRGLSVYF